MLFLGGLFLLGGQQSLIAQTANSLAKQATKDHASARYADAVWKLVNALNKKPTHDKAIDQMSRSFPAAIKQAESNIDRLKTSSATFSGPQTVNQREQVYTSYEALIHLIDAVRNLPEVKGKKSKKTLDFQYPSYQEEVREAQQQIASAKSDAAKMMYERGKRLMDQGGVDNNKSAAKSFKQAMEYVPGYQDASMLYAEARKAGTTRIAIIPFENISGKDHFGAIGQLITDEVIGSMLNNSASMEFVEIINRDQLEILLAEQNLGSSGRIQEGSAAEVGKVLGVHKIITGKITQIMTKTGPVTNRRYQVSKNVVIRKEKYLNDKGKERYRNIYGDVLANITAFQQSSSATIVGSYKLLDSQTGRLLDSKAFNETYTFDQSWGEGTGDERALGSTETSLLGRKQQAPPSDEEMVNSARQRVVNSVSQGVMSYVR